MARARSGKRVRASVFPGNDPTGSGGSASAACTRCPIFRQRLQVRFSKGGDLRFISHHDLMRLFERASRRAGLPLRMSEGFNPRPRISFPLSLAVGVEGQEEVAEIQLCDWVAPEEVRRRLAAAMPGEVAILRVEVADPARTAAVTMVSYLVEHPALAGLSPADLEELMARREVPAVRTRKGRRVTVDIRPYLRRLALVERTGEAPALRMELRVTPRGTARPDEVLAALGLDLPLTPASAPSQPPQLPPEARAPRIVREHVRLAGEIEVDR